MRRRLKELKVSDFPPDYPPFTAEHHDRQADGSPWTPDAILSQGGSCVVGPLGNFLAEPLWDKDGIIYAELSKDELTGSRVRGTQDLLSLQLTDRTRWISMPLDPTRDPIFCESLFWVFLSKANVIILVS